MVKVYDKDYAIVPNYPYRFFDVNRFLFLKEALMFLLQKGKGAMGLIFLDTK
jgi:hypothetical protein